MHQPARPTTLTDLDPLLGPTLRHTTGSTRRVALAVLVRGLSQGVSRTMLTVWLRSRGDDDMRALIDKPWWPDLLRDARIALGQTPSPTGGARLLVGHLLTSLPARCVGVSGRREVTARALFAVLGLEVLESMTDGVQVDGKRKTMKTALTTSGRLGVKTGMSGPTIRHATTLLEDAGWARRVKVVHRGPTRWALGHLKGDTAKDVEARFDSIIRALAEDNPDMVDPHLAADCIRLVTHPAWSFGSAPLGHTVWLVAVAGAAGVDATTLGVARSGVARARRALRTLLDGRSDLKSALDAHAAATGSSSARDEAEATRVAKAKRSAWERADHDAHDWLPPITAPSWFDPSQEGHVAQVVAAIEQQQGPGWEFASFAPRTRQIIVKRPKGTPPPEQERKKVRVPAGFDALANSTTLLARIEEQHGPGWQIESQEGDVVTLVRLASSLRASA